MLPSADAHEVIVPQEPGSKANQPFLVVGVGEFLTIGADGLTGTKRLSLLVPP